jgi:hypothetical protein
MAKSLSTAFVDLLESPSLSDVEIRRLIGWSALSLTDLLRRRCITIRYAERTLFNLDVVRKLEQRGLADCVELIDWGMQLEDWEAHTPDRLAKALTSVAQRAQQLLATSLLSPPLPPAEKRAQ